MTTILMATPPRQDAPLALRPVVDLATGDQVAGWSTAPDASLDQLTTHVRDWPTWRWLGLDAHLLPSDETPGRYPGRPVVMSLTTTATRADADRIRALGTWSNVAVRGLGADLRAASEVVHRINPDVAIIDGNQVQGLPRSTCTLVLAGLTAMLQDLDVLPILAVAGAVLPMLEAARDAGLRVVV